MTSTLEHWHRLRVQLRDARLAAGLTQEQVGDYIRGTPDSGERRSWISRIECGRAVPEIPTVIGMARAVGREVVVVPNRVERLMSLSDADVAIILRGAQAAATGHAMVPVDTYRVRLALSKLGNLG